MYTVHIGKLILTQKLFCKLLRIAKLIQKKKKDNIYFNPTSCYLFLYFACFIL